MLIDLFAIFDTVLKFLFWITVGWLVIVGHVLILIYAHAAIEAVSSGISLDAGLTPFHTAVMANDYAEAYRCSRGTVLGELPFCQLFDAVFVQRKAISFPLLIGDTAKAALAGLISYLLCRINCLLSSERHPILFGIFTSFWTSLSLFGAAILHGYIERQTFGESLASVIALDLIIAVGAAGMTIVLIRFSLMRSGIKLSFRRLWIEEGKTVAKSVLDAFVLYLLSAASFELLHPLLPDSFELYILIGTIAFFGSLIYGFVKDRYLIDRG